LRPVREEVVSAKTKTEKREGTPLAGNSSKRTKTSNAGSTAPSLSISTIPQIRCSACHKDGPVGKVLKCKQCDTRVHASACGVIPEAGIADSWTCDLCQNEKLSDASLNTGCVLCPPPRRDKKTGKNIESSAPVDSFLRMCKPTEGQCWAHVLCSVFMPDLKFTDASRLRLVEGISIIHEDRWSTRCSICSREGGTVLQCADCSDTWYHASCAWVQGHKFGFEMVKGTQRANANVVTFKDYTGTMSAIVRCKKHEHPPSRRGSVFFDICETNEFGETALQVYCRKYKQAQVAQSYGLLRKARRLDSIIDVPPEKLSGNDRRKHRCKRCLATVSPRWKEISRIGLLCHMCCVKYEDGLIVQPRRIPFAARITPYNK